MSRANSLEVALHIADATVRNLESQNQALQERIEELTRDNYRMHLLYEIKPPEKNALERIEELEAMLPRMSEQTVAYVCRAMRSVAVGLREEVMDYLVPVQWTPPDDEVFAGNLDFGEADITVADMLEVFAHLLDGGPLNPAQEIDR